MTARKLIGSVVAAEATRRGQVLLLAPRRGIGPARLAIASGDGRLRVVGLPRIVAGRSLSGESR